MFGFFGGDTCIVEDELLMTMVLFLVFVDLSMRLDVSNRLLFYIILLG